MKVSNKDLLHIFKSAFFGGVFSLMAYTAISATYYFSQDEIEIFSRALKANTLNAWFENHFGLINMAFNKLGTLIGLLATSFIGYFLTIFSVAIFDYTKKYLIESLNRKSIYTPKGRVKK